MIDDFLEQNKKQVICEFYVKGSCRYGDSCKYMHPKGSYTGDFANSIEEQAYINEYD